ncbi:MAG: hypothetical protein HP001_08780 [Oscillospiraceae bacterium]|nr:hypothetical protein [Oscillospiraceae bacterium]
MKNVLREKMLSGEKTLGTFMELGTATAAECLGLAGLDYLIIDTEHGPFNPQSALDFIRAAKLYNITPLARVQEISRAAILKLLDVGAMGLIIPCVNTVEEAKTIVSYGKYAPVGERGVANTAGSGFWFEDYASHGMPAYFETSNRETLLFPQCETLGCLEHLEEIVILPGIDGIFVGPFDLSTAMGIPGQFDKPEFKEALRHIQAVCARANKPSIIFAASESAAREGFQMGYDSVTYGMDATMLVNAFRAARAGIVG